ncbi:MAG: OmpA family protein [Hyphomicrobiales bacterium]|nr:MAG: OmpA family protein [Hyphomicrobiales bacterium]
MAGTSSLDSYLAGNEPAPRSFQFEKLNFDTANSNVRPADAAEVNEIATVLKQYGNAHVRIAGYADARGSSAANNALGKARADAVKAALVGQGIDAGRIETVSGGEADPVGNNATTSGQAENRRTELVVTSR